MDKGQIILYQTSDGESKIEVRLENDTVWLSADQMAELFQRNKSTISRHIKNVLEDGELEESAVVAFFATTAVDGKSYSVAFYNLDMIISIGYRVNSFRGVQFRIWATKVLKEYIVKGFALNDDLLKRAGGGNYFDELLARIRDIRSSEKVFYRKVLEIYALSIDYVEPFGPHPCPACGGALQMKTKISARASSALIFFICGERGILAQCCNLSVYSCVLLLISL